MMSDVTLGVELRAKQEMVEAILDSIRYERGVMNSEESSDEDKRIAQNRLKDLSKTLVELTSTEDHAYLTDKMKLEIDKISLEIEKLEAASKEAKKARWYDGIKTGMNWVVGGITTALGIKAARDNMKVLQHYEEEHYVATTAEKQAIANSINVLDTVRKFENKMGIK